MVGDVVEVKVSYMPYKLQILYVPLHASMKWDNIILNVILKDKMLQTKSIGYRHKTLNC